MTDPDLKMAREIVVRRAHSYFKTHIEEGHWDDTNEVQIALAGIKAGRAEGVAEERERLVSYHKAEIARWQDELRDRRSWGGPTIGEQECFDNIKAHQGALAAAIRKGGEHE